MGNKMFKKSIFSLFVFLGLFFALVGCQTRTYKVTFEVEGSVLKEVEVEEGKTVAQADVPADPVKAGHEFVGWYNGTEKFSSSTTITKDVKYVAKFEEVEPTVFKVTFEVDGSVAKEVEVEEGQKLKATDLPTEPTKANHHFVGWFNGDDELDLNAPVTANVKYVARFVQINKYTVTFEVEGSILKEVEVEEGKTIDPAEVPQDPSKKAHEFVGWFNGEDEFDEMAPVSESVKYTAKFNRTHYIVTFGDQEVLVKVGETLSLEGIESPSLADAFFAGWLGEGVFASEGMAVEKDMNFVAKFVTKADFDGVWVTDDGLWVEITDGNAIGNFLGSSSREKEFSFDVATGKIEYRETDTIYLNKHSFEVTATGIKYEHIYYDNDDLMTDELELHQAEDTIYTGVYSESKSQNIEIIGGNVIKSFYSTLYKGLIVETDHGLEIQYYRTESDVEEEELTTLSVVIDEKGNLVVDNKIYVKNSTDYRYYYNSENPQINIFTVDGELLVVVSDQDVSYYATYEGTFAEGQIVEVNYNEKTLLIKIGAGTAYEVPGSERGTYTQAENTLVLDGFGSGTLNDEPVEYEINAANVAVIGDKGYKLNFDDHSYTDVEKDSVNNGKYIYEASKSYSLVLDGFGGAMVVYTSSYSGDTIYKGTYQLAGNKITISNCNTYYANGEWTIEENGNVLSQGDKVYILEGVTVTDHKEELNGKYGENGEIVVTTGKISVNGTDYTLTYNYNGSKATFEQPHTDNPNLKDKVTISKTAEGKLLVETTVQEFDGDGYLTYGDTTSKEYAPYVAKELDAFKGTWKGKIPDGADVTFVFNGDGTGTYDGNAITYEVKDGELVFEYNYDTYTLSGDPSTGKLSVLYDFTEDTKTFEVTKQ